MEANDKSAAPDGAMVHLEGGSSLPTVDGDLLTIRGVVDKVFTSNVRFSAGKLRLEDGTLEGFAGKLMVRLGDPVILRGTWGDHPKYGRRFDVVKWDFDSKPSMDGLANYLAKSAAGIGPTKARRIVEAFGGDFERVLF